MRQEMKSALELMLKTDPTISPDQTAAALFVLELDPKILADKFPVARSILDGRTPAESAEPLYKRAAVAKLLCVHIRTVDYYGRVGQLDRVYGAGKRIIGFTRASVLKKLHGSRTPVKEAS